MTSAGVRSRPARCCRPGSGALCRSVWAGQRNSLRPLLPRPLLTLSLSLQLAQEALPANASQKIHAFSSTTLDDILRSFSEVSAARVAGGYLLMVGPASSTLASPPASFHPGNPCLRPCPLPTAGLCLHNNATVGLRPVPGCRGSCWGAAGGPGSGLRPWALCPSWHHFQCCYYSGKPELGRAAFGAISR